MKKSSLLVTKYSSFISLSACATIPCRPLAGKRLPCLLPRATSVTSSSRCTAIPITCLAAAWEHGTYRLTSALSPSFRAMKQSPPCLCWDCLGIHTNLCNHDRFPQLIGNCTRGTCRNPWLCFYRQNGFHFPTCHLH